MSHQLGIVTRSSSNHSWRGRECLTVWSRARHRYNAGLRYSQEHLFPQGLFHLSSICQEEACRAPGRLEELTALLAIGQSVTTSETDMTALTAAAGPRITRLRHGGTGTQETETAGQAARQDARGTSASGERIGHLQMTRTCWTCGILASDP